MIATPPLGLEQTSLAAPRTIEEACAELAKGSQPGHRTVLLAGGTDWIVDRHLLAADKVDAPDRVLDLTRIAALREHAFESRGGEPRLVLGGGVTYDQLIRTPAIANAVPLLAAMARDVGAVQIQTRGTLAGNLATASPAGDGVAALMALDALVEVQSVRGLRSIAIEDFFTGYRKTALAADEIIVRIDCRVPQPHAQTTWRKVGTRLAQAISKVALAAVIERDGPRITRARFGMASVAPVTHALGHVRRYLESLGEAPATRPGLDRALEQDIKPIDDVRSTGAYRLHVAKNLVWRAVHPAES